MYTKIFLYKHNTNTCMKRNTMNNAMLQFAKRQRNYVCCNTVVCVQSIMTANDVYHLHTYIPIYYIYKILNQKNALAARLN